MRMQYSKHLIEMPDFSGALNLQIIDFQGCIRLLEISSSIRYLKNLKELNVEDCPKINSVPSTKGLRSLIKLILRDCWGVEKLSAVSENIEELDLSGTRIKELPSCSQLRSLRKLNLLGCPILQKFPEISTSVEELYLSRSDVFVPYLIESLSRLQTLQLDHWTGCGNILENLGRLSSLRELNLSYSSFEYIPACIKHLSYLENLLLSSCNSLQSLPELPPHLKFLNANNCTSLQMVTNSKFALVQTLEKLPDFRVNFLFLNCHQLNEDASRNVSNHALQIIRLFAREAHYQLPKSVGGKDEVCFVYPGNEIPDWINLQSTGSSITVELPQNWCDSKNFFGFVICAVFDEAAQWPWWWPSTHLFCECHFESNDAVGNLKFGVDLMDSHFMFPSGAHVVLRYSSSLHRAIVSSFEEEYYYKKATFRFYLEILSKQLPVTNCGVQLLHIGD